ncbi:MAG: nicotinate-nucleotide adenylyltransferase [Beijerinckiaceae bacterium]
MNRPFPSLPRHAPGLKIGLFGGSFNPPHDGHRLVTLLALRRLGLDAVWWIVTPGNPLKDVRQLAPLAERMAAARQLMPEPQVAITGFEAEIGTRYTLDTLRYLRRRCRGVRFVWVMGADNLAQFHRWQGWREIARLMPICVVDRPRATLKATASRAGQRLKAARFPEHLALAVPRARPPALVFIHGRRSPLSSTLLRNSG